MNTPTIVSALKDKLDLLNREQLEQLNSLADLFLNTAPGSSEWDELTPASKAKFEKSLHQVKEGQLESHAEVQARMRAKHLGKA